jgi:hypothetical protein
MRQRRRHLTGARTPAESRCTSLLSCL